MTINPSTLGQGLSRKRTNPIKSSSDGDLGDESEEPPDEHAVLVHVLLVVLKLQPESYIVIKQWLEHKGITSMSELVELFNSRPDNLNDEEYMVNNTLKRCKLVHCTIVKSICKYAVDFRKANQRRIEDSD